MSLPPLHQLATFVAVVDAGSFDAAARELGITGSAVSQRVRGLEVLLGRGLLQRTTPVEVTTAGGRLLPYARRLVELAGDAAVQVRDGAEAGPGVLRIAVNADSLATWFMDAIVTYPGRDAVVFDLERSDETRTAAALTAGRVAAAVTIQAEPAHGCTAVRLGCLRYLCVASPTFLERHGIVAGDAGVAPALVDAPYVEFDADDTLQRDFLTRWTGLAPRGARHRIPGPGAFGRAVEAGLGWGLLPEAQARAAEQRGALVILTDDAAVEVPLHWQAWQLAPAALVDFGSWVRRVAESRLGSRR